jgi:hypothetical protein
MNIHSDILSRLKDIDPLTCKTQVYSWPVTYRNGLDEYYNEYARITGHWTTNWRWGSPTQYLADTKRCEDLGIKTCLHISPDVPKGLDWEKAKDDYANRWKTVSKSFDLSLVDVSYIDLEGFSYIVEQPLTDASVRYNEAVHQYNKSVYDIAKQFLGDSVPIRRYGHMHTARSTSASRGRQSTARYTTAFDPVDGGWGMHFYSPMLGSKDMETLELTIQQAKQHGIQEGSAWVAVGCSVVNWLCPGLEVPYPKIKYSSTMYAWPYNPSLSHRMGSLLANNWWRRVEYGEDYSNDVYPALAKIHSAVIWPGVFSEEMDRTAVHLVAFLEGLSIKKFDTRLQEIQVEAVNSDVS